MSTGLTGIDLAARITSDEALSQHYGEPAARSLIKEIDYISEHYRAFVERAPFVVVATAGDGGLDCSPRGDPPGFVRVHDEKTLLIPDRKGNNRLDTLRNLVHDPRISLLFLIPGKGETLRVNGRASIVVDAALCESFAMNGKAPATVLEVSVERVYFQCQKALARSRLWDAGSQIERGELPSAGDILQALSTEEFDGKRYDENYPEYMKQNMY